MSGTFSKPLSQQDSPPPFHSPPRAFCALAITSVCNYELTGSPPSGEN